MLSRFRELFAPKPEAPAADEGERLRVATCVVLLEVAGADNEFSPEECERVIEALRQRFQLSQEEAEQLIQVAEEQRENSLDLWQFTNQINETCGTAEKMHIIEQVWRVVYADGVLEGHEDYLVHKLARLFNLDHSQLIDAKMKVLKEVRGS